MQRQRVRGPTKKCLFKRSGLNLYPENLCEPVSVIYSSTLLKAKIYFVTGMKIRGLDFENIVD